MKILFREEDIFPWIYYIDKDGILSCSGMEYFDDDEIRNAIDITELDILYHYIDKYGVNIPVYYEHNDKIVAYFNNKYDVIKIQNHYTKDYTIINLNLLEDGDNI